MRQEVTKRYAGDWLIAVPLLVLWVGIGSAGGAPARVFLELALADLKGNLVMAAPDIQRDLNLQSEPTFIPTVRFALPQIWAQTFVELGQGKSSIISSSYIRPGPTKIVGAQALVTEVNNAAAALFLVTDARGALIAKTNNTGKKITIRQNAGNAGVGTNTKTAATKVKDNKGEVDVTNNSGKFIVFDNASNVHVKSSSGRIEIDDNAKTISIDATARGARTIVNDNSDSIFIDRNEGVLEVGGNAAALVLGENLGSLVVHDNTGSIHAAGQKTKNDGVVDVLRNRGRRIDLDNTKNGRINVISNDGTINIDNDGLVCIDDNAKAPPGLRITKNGKTGVVVIKAATRPVQLSPGSGVVIVCKNTGQAVDLNGRPIAPVDCTAAAAKAFVARCN